MGMFIQLYFDFGIKGRTIPKSRRLHRIQKPPTGFPAYLLLHSSLFSHTVSILSELSKSQIGLCSFHNTVMALNTLMGPQLKDITSVSWSIRPFLPGPLLPLQPHHSHSSFLPCISAVHSEEHSIPLRQVRFPLAPHSLISQSTRTLSFPSSISLDLWHLYLIILLQAYVSFLLKSLP